MQKIYFTSDWHLFHKNIIKYSNRPFKDVEFMNASLLKMFYSKVKEGDIVYFLGDFAFNSRSRENGIVSILKEITEFVEFHFILGNHDHNSKHIYEKYCASVSNLKEIKIEGKYITLCHYAMHTFNYSHFNSWQLYGHHHYNSNVKITGKRFNVSVDANNFQMISFQELKKIMERRNNNWDYIDRSIRKKERKN
ncbi:MAG: metallophosphoesterase [Promethearchaeota archaeon]